MTDPAPPNPDDDVADLRERILATKEAAERLHARAEEARRTDAGGGTPPSGWATPQDRGERADEVHALAELVRVLREIVPTELRGQVTEVLRQLLLLLRAILDWWVDRLSIAAPGPAGPGGRPAPAGPPHVEDIPIR